MVGRWGGIFFLLIGFLNLLSGQEEFRTFTASTGQAFTGRVLSYEGQTFYIEGKDKKLYPVPFKQLSAPDQKYLIEIAQAGKIPKGDPRTLKQDSAPAEQTDVADSVEQQGEARPKLNVKAKPSFRPGSFFAYKPVNLGQDPNIALTAEKVSVIPAPGEAIDFKKHVLPIMEERCLSCHNAPYDKNGRTIHPKAGLRLDTYEWVMKGNLDNTVVEAGNLADSYLHEVVTLDEEDDMFMPPKGGPLSAEQIDVIKRWIEEGAKESAGGGELVHRNREGI